MVVNLTKQELTDIRQGLIIAMKTLDETTGEGTDKILSDRLEVIENKLSKL